MTEIRWILLVEKETIHNTDNDVVVDDDNDNDDGDDDFKKIKSCEILSGKSAKNESRNGNKKQDKKPVKEKVKEMRENI